MKKTLLILFCGFLVLNATACTEVKTVSSVKTTKEANVIEENPVVKEEVKPATEVTQVVVEEQLKQLDTVPTNVIVNNEQDIVNYAIDLSSSVDNYLNSENLEKAKILVAEKFIIITDFIFYDTEIGGVKFNDLTEETKAKILEIAYYMDSKIESKIPNYKTSLKDKYNIASSYVKEKYDYFSNIISNKVKENVSAETINNFTEAKEDIVQAASTTGEIISTVYDKAKDNVSSWYQKLKDKY